MKLSIVQNLTPYNFNAANRGKGDIKYIVIHYFGTLAPAQNVAQYFANDYRGASAHYCIDEGSIAYQCVRDKDISWHCGTDGDYWHPYCRNSNSIGIEVRPFKLDASTAASAAPPDWYFPQKVIDNLVELTRYLMDKYGIPPENVVRHYDVTGKWCPRPFMGDDINTYYKISGNAQWEKFKARLKPENSQQEEPELTKAEIEKIAKAAAAVEVKRLNPVYNTVDDVPEYWREDVKELVAQGVIKGEGGGKLGLTHSETKVAVIVKRALEKHTMESPDIQ